MNYVNCLLRKSMLKSCVVYLLDDPLAAVDGSVGKDLLINCILDLIGWKKAVVLFCLHLH